MDATEDGATQPPVNIVVEPQPLPATLDGGDGSVMVCAKPDVGPRLCGAQLRGKPGQFCKRPALESRSKCAYHGGKTPRGSESPHFKTGFYSKALPKQLKADFDKLFRDPELLSNRAEIALLAIRHRQLAARVGTNESGETWRTLARLFDEFMQANGAGDQDAQVAAVNRINEIITGAVNDEHAWAELTEFTEQATKISERESKRLVRARQVVTAEQLRTIFAAVTNLVLNHVQDHKARLAIAEGLDRLHVLDAVNVSAEPEPEGRATE